MNGYGAPTAPGAGGPYVKNASNQPTDWWQQSAKSNGYYWDSIANTYKRNPSYLAQQKADATNTYMKGVSPSLSALMGQFGSMAGGMMGGGSGTAPGFEGGPAGGGGGTGGGGVGNVAPIQPPDMTAANTAIFAKAKDRAGSLARASLNSLNGELGASGMIGSGAQAQATRDIVQGGAGMLEDTNNAMTVNNAQQAADFAKMGYQGSITQRGQDIQKQEADAQLALAQQDRYMKMLQTLMGMFGSMGSLSGMGGGGGGPEIL